ncbi:MAG: acyl-CoA dehydrogenase family protein [Acidimicrobiales bacterium]
MTDTTTPHPNRFSVDELLLDSAENLFASTCSFDAVQAAEESGWADGVWNAVAEAGFAWIGLPESAGGSGGSLLDACEVLRIAGAHAAPIPLAETALTGGWLLAKAGLRLPDGPVSVVPGTSADTLVVTASDDGGVVLDGSVHRVPWVNKADCIAALVSVEGDPEGQQRVLSIRLGQTLVEPFTNMAGEPRETMHFAATPVPADHVGIVEGPVADELRLRGALSRTMMMAGALEAMSKLTVDYTEQRQQFGKPVGRFQAVQQHLVWGAQDAAIAKMTAQVAAARASDDVVAAEFEIAAARTVAEDSASTATRWAHQAHGAMGMTQEYALHHLSRRLWAWRHEYATPGEWAKKVGRLAEQGGAEGLYPLIASQP